MTNAEYIANVNVRRDVYGRITLNVGNIFRGPHNNGVEGVEGVVASGSAVEPRFDGIISIFDLRLAIMTLPNLKVSGLGRLLRSSANVLRNR